MLYTYHPLFGLLYELIWWGLIVIGIVALIKYLRSSSIENKEPSSALKILEERYAKGEINKEEFENKRTHILNIPR